MDAMIVALIVLFVGSLGGFFAWLGATVVNILGRVIGVEKDVKSLLETRTEQKAEKVAGTAERLSKLEKGAAPVTDTATAMNVAADAADETAEAAVLKAGEVRKRADEAEDDNDF